MTTKTLVDGTKYTKANYYDGESILTGTWEIFIKLDGVRALRMADGSVVSRNSKPLHNLDHLTFTDAEIYAGDWESTITMVRSESYQEIHQHHVYQLDPPDPRLHIVTLDDPTPALLDGLMREQLAAGQEGLVIRKGKKWLKVVPELQADVRITGFKAGTGKFQGSLGSVLTDHASIGTGFDDELRQEIWDNQDEWLGKIIQVGYRELTPGGKLRFPRFVCQRFDKDDESI